MFIFGEKIVRSSGKLEDRYCPVCDSSKPFQAVKETNYFCLFGLALLPLEKHADFHLCSYCENAFPVSAEGVYELPSQAESARHVIAYLLVGYGMHQHLELGSDVFKKVTGFELPQDQLQQLIRQYDSAALDAIEFLKASSSHMNVRGKRQIIEAAFLVTHACCEIEYEDRLRINLLANSLGLPISFVSATIEQVRQQGCYGVRRILPTQTSV